jgi:hypothetical protein
VKLLVLWMALGAGDHPCLSRAVECISRCNASAMCVAQCTRAQRACEVTRGQDDEVQAVRQKKCFDSFGDVMACPEPPSPKSEPPNPLAGRKGIVRVGGGRR